MENLASRSDMRMEMTALAVKSSSFYLRSFFRSRKYLSQIRFLTAQLYFPGGLAVSGNEIETTSGTRAQSIGSRGKMLCGKLARARAHEQVGGTFESTGAERRRAIFLSVHLHTFLVACIRIFQSYDFSFETCLQSSKFLVQTKRRFKLKCVKL